jgi:uncharacterized phage protein gp47/JayE
VSGFQRPSRATLIERNKGDLNARLTGADSRLRRSAVGSLATMHAGALDGAYGYLDYVSDQIIPDTADLAHLIRWASFWGVFPKAAVAATGTAASAGVCANGVDIPIGTVLQAGDHSDFVTTTDVVTAGAAADLVVAAVTPGVAGNLAAGVTLTMVSPIGGVSSTFTIDAPGLAGGADPETPAELLARLEQRVQNPPQGGGPGDYVGWALQVPGVTRAWEYPLWMGLGTVGVAFVFDDRMSILPTGGDVTAMQAWLASLAPVTALPVAFAPTADVIAFTIVITPDTPALRAAVTAQLADFFSREATPGGELLASQYELAIGLTEGLTDFVVSVPAGNITPGPGQLPTLGAITW